LPNAAPLTLKSGEPVARQPGTPKAWINANRHSTFRAGNPDRVAWRNDRSVSGGQATYLVDLPM